MASQAKAETSAPKKDSLIDKDGLRIALMIVAIVVAFLLGMYIMRGERLVGNDDRGAPEYSQEMDGPADVAPGRPSPEEAAAAAYETLGPVTDGKLKNHQMVENPDQPGIERCWDGSAPRMVKQAKGKDGGIHTRWACPKQSR